MKVGVVSFCNDGYPREELNTWLGQSTALLTGYEVIDCGLVWDEAIAKEKRAMLRDVDVLVVPCLAACGSMYSVEFLREYFQKPILLWLAGGTFEEDGRLITGAAGAGYASLRMPLKRMGADKLVCVVGRPGEPSVKERIQAVLRAFETYVKLRASKILMIGYSDLGFYTGTFEPISLKEKLGVEVVHIPSLSLMDRIHQVKPQETEEFREMYTSWVDGADASGDDINKIARLYIALKTLVKEYHGDGLTLKCFEGFTQCMGYTPCIPLSLLGENICTGCKCDIHGMVSQLILKYLGKEPAAFMELYDVRDEKLLMANCGLTPSHHIRGTRRTDRFSWGGIDGIIDASSRKTGSVTLLRFDKDEKNQYRIHTAPGVANTSGAWKELGWDDPAPAFPSLDISVDTNRFMEHVLGQHYAVMYGQYKEELSVLAKILNMEIN